MITHSAILRIISPRGVHQRAPREP
jgi:hypothetical protein